MSFAAIQSAAQSHRALPAVARLHQTRQVVRAAVRRSGQTFGRSVRRRSRQRRFVRQRASQFFVRFFRARREQRVRIGGRQATSAREEAVQVARAAGAG